MAVSYQNSQNHEKRLFTANAKIKLLCFHIVFDVNTSIPTKYEVNRDMLITYYYKRRYYKGMMLEYKPGTSIVLKRNISREDVSCQDTGTIYTSHIFAAFCLRCTRVRRHMLFI